MNQVIIKDCGHVGIVTKYSPGTQMVTVLVPKRYWTGKGDIGIRRRPASEIEWQLTDIRKEAARISRVAQIKTFVTWSKSTWCIKYHNSLTAIAAYKNGVEVLDTVTIPKGAKGFTASMDLTKSKSTWEVAAKLPGRNWDNDNERT